MISCHKKKKEKMFVWIAVLAALLSTFFISVITPPRPSENSIFRHKISPFLSSCVIEN